MVSNDSTPNTQLIRFARYGFNDDIQMALNNGADINAVDEDGLTALHWAARRCYAYTIELLIERGAKVNMKALNGRTALHEAALINDSGSARVLISKGADITIKDCAGTTPLDLAIQAGHQTTANMLDREMKQPGAAAREHQRLFPVSCVGPRMT